MLVSVTSELTALLFVLLEVFCSSFEDDLPPSDSYTTVFSFKGHPFSLHDWSAEIEFDKDNLYGH